MVVARLRALTHTKILNVHLILLCRNGISPVKGIDTPYYPNKFQEQYFVEMVLARLKNNSPDCYMAIWATLFHNIIYFTATIIVASSAAFVIIQYSFYNGLCYCILILLIQFCIVLVIHKTNLYQDGRPVCMVQKV